MGLFVVLLLLICREISMGFLLKSSKHAPQEQQGKVEEYKSRDDYLLYEYTRGDPGIIPHTTRVEHSATSEVDLV